MDNDILFFFGGHMDTLPIYERLEGAILGRIPDAKGKGAKSQITFKRSSGGVGDNLFRSGLPQGIPQNRCGDGTLSRSVDPPCDGGNAR